MAENDPSAGTAGEEPKPQYVVSQATGLAFHPDDIVESCRRLQESLARMQDESERAIRRWEGGIRERELAERRRVAPGWLDVGEAGRGLVPERAGGGGGGGGAAAAQQQQRQVEMEQGGAEQRQQDAQMAGAEADEGAELDRAFGSLSMR
jgi:hypothetical protein